MKSITVFLLAYVSVIFSLAQPVILLNKDKVDNLGTSTAIFEDSTQKLTISEVLKYNDKFQVVKKNVFNSSPTLSAFWVRLYIKNPSPKHFFLEISNPTIDEIDLYTIVGNKIIHLGKSGDFLKFSDRLIKRNDFVFPLDLVKDKTQVFYLRYTCIEELVMPITIATPQALIEKFYIRDLFNGVYYGILLFAILYNLFLFIELRDLSYLYYSASLTFLSLLQAELLGHAFQFFFPNNSWLSNFGMFLFSDLALIFVISFARIFLNTKDQAPRLHKLGFYLQVICAISILLGLFYRASSSLLLLGEYLSTLLGFLVPNYLIVLGVVIALKGYRAARFYILASSCFLLSVGIYMLKNIGILPHVFLTDNIMRIGSALEALLFSFALGDRYSLLKKEKEATQLELNKELELKIVNHKRVQEEQKKLNERLQNTNENLVKTNLDLDNFVYTASHELKAPILNIEGMINLLESQGADEQEFLKIVRMMKTSVVSFKNTANDLEDIATIQKKYEKDIEDVKIDNVVEEVKLNFRDELEESEAEIKIDVEKCPTIHFSKRNMKRVLYNLLSNAIKFRDSDRQLKILIQTDETKEYKILCVTDNGIGISKEKQSKIFSIFKRAHDHLPGRGIGLYIVKKIIENQGGKINVESEVGKGTTFRLYFLRNDR